MTNRAVRFSEEEASFQAMSKNYQCEWLAMSEFWCRLTKVGTAFS